ncbi:MAG: hypothetical protein FWD69_06150 [Polyangiaceae bacterium]|nr:hypothetical protein [Polyangiaceae bacterium]
MTVQNLDAECAKLGATLGTNGTKDTENSITKTLGVLEEQGVYALFLYLHAREKEWGKSTSCEFAKFLRQHSLLGSSTKDEPFGALQELATDLDKLLFARDLLYRALVYARYHAKAAQKGTPEKTT